MRREFSTKVRVAAFERSAGACDKCAAKLFPGNIEYDHEIPCALGGASDLSNCVVLCRACHGVKTHGKDQPRIAKTKRQRASHIGAKTRGRPMPGSKASGWRKPMNGPAERRT